MSKKIISIEQFKKEKCETADEIQSAIDSALWCKHCGAMIGLYDSKTEEFITEGNFCPYCGTRIRE